MLFGKSVFQSILTRLDDEAPEEDAVAEEPSFRISGLNAGFVAPVETREAPARASDAYFSLLADRPEEPTDAAPAAAPTETAHSAPPCEPEPVMPAFLGRLSETEVAEDLGVDINDNETRLAEKRRAFARLNHPDCVHPNFRREATIRMTLANMLIDRALRISTLR